jgi:hypothetical protein
MFLIDANVVSGVWKGAKANPGVTAFFNHVSATGAHRADARPTDFLAKPASRF